MTRSIIIVLATALILVNTGLCFYRAELAGGLGWLLAFIYYIPFMRR